MLWRHVTINTKNSWLHGDERGFRNRQHRIHSSGDYNNPPPKTEHAGLRRYNETGAADEIEIEPELRPLIVRAFTDWLLKEKHKVLTVACGENHLHALVQLPDDLPQVKRIIGYCKRRACEAVKHKMSGPTWSANGTYKLIKDYDHQCNTFDYIRSKQGPGTFVWTYRHEEYWMLQRKRKTPFIEGQIPTF